MEQLNKLNIMKKLLTLFVIGVLCLSNASAQSKNGVYGSNPSAGHYAKINGIDMYYEIYGNGKPLLMLHGNGGSIDAFKFQIPFFEKYFKVIAVDSRLQGKSGGSVDTLSYDMMAADFAALLDYLQIDSAYVLGWSDGGIDGIILAMNYPSKVKKLAVSGANTVPDTSAISIKDINEMKSVVSNPATSQIEKTLNRMLIDQPQIAYSDLKKISCPVLVMAGDRDFVKPGHTLKIFQSIPFANLCIFPDSGHGVCRQRPELFNEVVFDFFEKYK